MIAKGMVDANGKTIEFSPEVDTQINATSNNPIANSAVYKIYLNLQESINANYDDIQALQQALIGVEELIGGDE